MATARLDIAYVGTGFAGWATQRDKRTVQAELEAAIERIVGEPVDLVVAGRTDAGVHASGQVASFEHERGLPDRLAVRLNAVLPADVAVKAAAPVPDGFSARFDAKRRDYRYRVLGSPLRRPFEHDRALWWRHPLDRELLDACAQAIVGTHDFTAFTPTQTAHRLFERTIDEASWGWEGEIGNFDVAARSFMRAQIRVFVGTMLEVAGGRRSLDDFRALLEGAPRERAGETAPAHGLYLTAVSY